MKYIIISEANVASRNIGKFLENKKFGKDINIIKTENNVLELDSNLKNIKDAEIVIVASSHKSEAGVPMLNAHFTGNFGEDVSHGGSARTLAIAPALYQRAAVLEYAKLQAADGRLRAYKVGIEATHHGPTLNLPILFVEVGSTEKEWNDLAACGAAAKVIMKLVSGAERSAPSTYGLGAAQAHEKIRVVTGFGGGHYCPQFTKKLFDGGFAFGHICPKYAANNLTEDIIMQAINKTVPKPEKVLVEWKGLTSDHRKKIIEILEKNKIKWEKV